MRAWRVPYPKFGTGPGLKRVAAIAERLGIDLPSFGERGAVIVGSNGKGSTAAMTAAILERTGDSVGLFTSPHLFDLNERFRVDGEDITDADLERHWARVNEAAAPYSADLGGFEFLFLIAADWFAAKGCKHTIWEAGIGGRLDPVRLIQARRLALTSLDLEHAELLGPTLDDIAREKVDAAPDGATIYVAASCAPQQEAIKAHCRARHLRPVFADGGSEHETPLRGEHQSSNASLAVSLARHAAGEALSQSQIAAGLAAVRWPGRLETINSDPLIVIDVGHTPAAIRAALAGFEKVRGERPGLLVVGASQDKDYAAMVASLAPPFPFVVCASARHKGAPAALIAKQAAAANPDAEFAITSSVEEAHAVALARARARGAAIYVAGGLFLAAEFKAVHLGRDPASLAFF